MTHTARRRRPLPAIGACLGRRALAKPAFAQSRARARAQWPTKPVCLLVPHPPGSAIDIIARTVAERPIVQLDQSFIVDNRSGGGRNINAEHVARAPADCSALLVTTTAYAVSKSQFAECGYGIVSDFVPVSFLTLGPLGLVGNPDLAATDVHYVTSVAKARPASTNFASFGIGQSTRFAGEPCATASGQLSHLPYKEDGSALNEVIVGHVPIALEPVPFVKAGRPRVLGVTGTEQSCAIPEMPTQAESRLLGVGIHAWSGLLALEGPPKTIARRVSIELCAAVAHPVVQPRLQEQGLGTVRAELAYASVRWRSQVDRWARVIEPLGAKVE